MKSKVFFVRVSENDNSLSVRRKLSKLLEESKILNCVDSPDKVAVKLHFGEEGNTGYVRPEYLKVIQGILAEKECTPFLADTNALYKGRRTNSLDHLKLAEEHGFSPHAIGADIIIPEDNKQNVTRVEINQKYVKAAKISSLFLNADAIIGVAHFKGHLMTGFGGALKNIGMGCASREGKLEQHCDVSPLVGGDNCVGCGMCIEVCPVNAISLRKDKANLDASLCVGCASCIAVCNYNAIDVRWESGADIIQEKMAEYTKAVLQEKERKVAFINFVTKVTKECDCLAKDDPRMAPDIGIFASQDPVGIDKASLDMLNKACGKEIFKDVHPRRDGLKQLKHAERIGLGSLEYSLIEIKS